MKTPKHNKKRIEQAIKGSSGLVLTVSQRLGVSRATVRNYLERYPDLHELMLEERENILDFAESKLIKKVEEGEAWAIKCLLSSQGSIRGYGGGNNSDKKYSSKTMEKERRYSRLYGLYGKEEEDKGFGDFLVSLD